MWIKGRNIRLSDAVSDETSNHQVDAVILKFYTPVRVQSVT